MNTDNHGKKRRVLATKDTKVHKDEKRLSADYADRPFVALIAVVNSSLSSVGRVLRRLFYCIIPQSGTSIASVLLC